MDWGGLLCTFQVAVTGTVFPRCRAAFPLEYPGQVALVPETGLDGDVGEQFVRGLQEPADGVEADGRDIAAWGDAECDGEISSEVAGRGPDDSRQLREGQLLGVVVGYVVGGWLEPAVPFGNVY